MRVRRSGSRLSLAVVLLLASCGNGQPEAAAGAQTSAARPPEAATGEPLSLTIEIVGAYPHDRKAFTQGLIWHEGWLYESTGLWGESSLRRTDLVSGTVEARLDLAPQFFGEGLARVDTSLVQLTWRSGLAFRYDLTTFEAQGEDRFAGEGWGLCNDGDVLWRSDGSSRLHRHDAASFSAVGSLEVHRSGRPVHLLNELECAEGWIYANILNSDEIVRIDPGTGAVVAVIDASGLLGPRTRPGPLNGIAYRPETGTFLLTGKRWPTLFEVTFSEPGSRRSSRP